MAGAAHRTLLYREIPVAEGGGLVAIQLGDSRHALVVDEAVERIKDGTIVEYEYDPASATLQRIALGRAR